MKSPFSETFLKQISYGLNIAKVVNYTAQGALLPFVEKLARGQKSGNFKEFKEHLQMALPKVEMVLRADANNIAAGYYPAQVIFQDNLVAHYLRVPRLLMDAFRASRQRVQRKSDFFETKDVAFVDEAPEYYRRNFHFQKGGYLNDDSASLYDHQVEVLFSGAAQAMRRQVIPLIKKHFNMSDGEGLKFLEIGSGTGSLTRAVALAFPKAQITCLDMSPHYLKESQKKLSEFKRINFVQGMAEDLNFKDETFDAVFSCYLFHELPEKIRKQVVAEKFRVLKNDGFMAVVDSIQKDDDTTLNWALDQFPKDFHEPFYKNYVENKVEDIFVKYKLSDLSTELAFLTKVVSAIKKSNDS